MMVTAELEKAGLEPLNVILGEADINKELTETGKQQLNSQLQTLGFALIDDRRSRIIIQIKSALIELVQQQNGLLKVNLSDYLSEKLQHDYNYLSNLFSEVEGITIEKYFIARKIEKVKELLVYDELTLSEIAFLLHYSSVAHLSNQFKKVTGPTPGHFKQIGRQKRKPLDKL
jgi:AraC-like DNA-binding protein